MPRVVVAGFALEPFKEYIDRTGVKVTYHTTQLVQYAEARGYRMYIDPEPTPDKMAGEGAQNFKHKAIKIASYLIDNDCWKTWLVLSHEIGHAITSEEQPDLREMIDDIYNRTCGLFFVVPTPKLVVDEERLAWKRGFNLLRKLNAPFPSLKEAGEFAYIRLKTYIDR